MIVNTLSATAPRRVRQVGGVLDRSVFLRPIAHRGLHDKAKGRIENSAPAFLAAISKGYGIECDLQAANDGTPMVFHDDRLERLVSSKGRISRQVPLLVEVKTNTATPLEPFLDRIARHARGYKGPIAVMSFERAVVAALAKLAPSVPCGAVIGPHQLPARWWATPAAAGGATIGRLL